jgi:hypothetical protein
MDWTKNKTIKYWDNPEWFQRRNAELVKDKLAGEMSNAELIAKYNITTPVINQIVKNSIKNESSEKGK